MTITCPSPFKPIPVPKPIPVFISSSPSSLPIPKQSLLRCNFSHTTEPQPVFTSVRSFAPATVANLVPHRRPRSPPRHAFNIGNFRRQTLQGSPLELRRNRRDRRNEDAQHPFRRPLSIPRKGPSFGERAWIQRRQRSCSRRLRNEIFGRKLQVKELVLAGLESEAKVSGYHADNIAPAIMGGFVLIRSYDPLELMTLKFPAEKELFFVLVSPDFEAPTKKMRAALPTEIGMAHHVWNCSQAGALVVSVLQGDAVGLGKVLSADKIVEPKRATLIPGMEGVKKAALEAGAYGCTISGAGPTAVAVVDDEERGKEIGERMVEGFWREGNLKAVGMVKRLDRVGARLVSSVAW